MARLHNIFATRATADNCAGVLGICLGAQAQPPCSVWTYGPKKWGESLFRSVVVA